MVPDADEVSAGNVEYVKTITVPQGYISDGATGAMDIASRAWFVHDVLCQFGKWDDGTKLSNWQCSQVLQDILVEEGRYWQSKRWFWATWVIGGGQARKNGMFSVAMILLMISLSFQCDASELCNNRKAELSPVPEEKSIQCALAATKTLSLGEKLNAACTCSPGYKDLLCDYRYWSDVWEKCLIESIDTESER